MIKDRRGVTSSFGACIEMPPVTCGTLATPLTHISCSPGPRSLGRTGSSVLRQRCREGWTADQSPGWRCSVIALLAFRGLVSARNSPEMLGTAVDMDRVRRLDRETLQPAESPPVNGPGVSIRSGRCCQALDTGLQAAGGPEDQRRPRQRQHSQPGQRPQPVARSEQEHAKDDVEDATGNAHTHPQHGDGGIPVT